jgi:3-deoxy-D-manno-octulosonic-acid transferase
MLDVLEPDLILYIKHDIWPNLTWEAADRGIPTVLVNGNFRPDSLRRKWYARPFNREVLGSLTAIYAVADDDSDRFRETAGSGITIETVGDTRYDRVRQRAVNTLADQGALRDLLQGRMVFVAGSTWPEDQARLLEAWAVLEKEFPRATLLIIPHEIEPHRIRRIREQAAGHGLSVEMVDEVDRDGRVGSVVIVNRMGVLAGLYGLGRIAYVGGGFGHGVHSVLEPGVFGIPVLFGPHHLMSHEARDLVRTGGGLEIADANDIIKTARQTFRGDREAVEMGLKAGALVAARTGTARLLARKMTQLAHL